MLTMPIPDQEVITRRAAIAAALRHIVPGEGVVEAPIEMRAFETDGLTAYRQMPLVVVLPETAAQVSAVLKYAHENEIKVVPRGAGTSLSGGALPLADGILLGMAKFNRVLEIDYANRCAVVQPCVTNLAITRAVEHKGFYYAPDPSSQIACTIGGNVAENSGGVHCLKYGLTANNVLGIEMVLVTGYGREEVLRSAESAEAEAEAVRLGIAPAAETGRAGAGEPRESAAARAARGLVPPGFAA